MKGKGVKINLNKKEGAPRFEEPQITEKLAKEKGKSLSRTTDPSDRGLGPQGWNTPYSKKKGKTGGGGCREK